MISRKTLHNIKMSDSGLLGPPETLKIIPFEPSFSRYFPHFSVIFPSFLVLPEPLKLMNIFLYNFKTCVII